MFDVMPYRTMSADDDLVAQRHAEGGSPPAALDPIGFLFFAGLISLNELRDWQRSFLMGCVKLGPTKLRRLAFRGLRR